MCYNKHQEVRTISIEISKGGQTQRVDPLSAEMREFLQEQKLESEIQAVLDAAAEAGLKDFTRQDAIKALLQEDNYKHGEEGGDGTF